MRILAIRGQNLASLATKFDLDLTREPLATAGFFAITGPTGAGKSTILDALCLALYGSFPRILLKGQENAPDASGETISAKDGRAILRRGAGTGFAEVDFIGQDDQSYRVRWSVSRARQKATGRLQTEERILSRLDDGQAIATGKKQVLEAVEAKTGLTFDQFRRTVLLAQGEFDAFLTADEDARAALLEKITGTEIYAAISIHVHDETDRRKKTVQDLEQRRAAMSILEDDMRAAHIAEKDALAEAALQKSLERKSAADRIEQLNALQKASAQLEKAKADLDAARTEQATALPDRQTLQKLEALEPMRTLKLVRDAAQKTHREAESRLASALSALGATKTKDEAAAAEFADAQKQHADAEVTFKAYAPLWDQASILDAKIEQAAQECLQAEKEEREARDDHDKAKNESDRTETALAQLIAAQDKACRELDERSASAIIAEREDDLIRLLEKRQQQSVLLHAAKTDGTEVRTRRDTLELRRGALGQQCKALQKKREELDDLLSQFQADLDALQVPSLEQQDTRLRQLLDATRDPLAQCDRFLQACGALARATQEAETASNEYGGASAEIRAAEHASEEARTSLAELEPLHELAESSVSQYAVELRSLLIDGQPCPVCGSPDHPPSSSLDQLQQLADRLRQRRDTIRASIDQHQRSLTEASAALAKAEARKHEAFLVAAAQKEAVLSAQKSYGAARPRIEALFVALPSAPALPDILDAATRPALQNLIAACEAAKSTLAGHLRHAASLRQTIDQTRKDHQALDRSLTDLNRDLRTIQDSHHQTEIALTNAEARAAALAGAMASADQELIPFLDIAGVSLTDLDPGPDAVVARLKNLAEAYRASKATALRLEKERQTLEPRKAEAAAKLLDADARHAKAASRLKQRADAAACVKSERAPLLDGESTGTHRTRINNARQQAFDHLTATQNKRSLAASDYQAALAIKDQAAEAWEKARREHAVASEDYDCQCAASGETVELIETLLTLAPEQRDLLARKVRAIDDKCHAADAAYLNRKAEAEYLDATTDQTIAPESLLSVINQCDTDIAAGNRRFGEIAAILDRDDLQRQHAAALSSELDAASQKLAIARAVHDAIGSATGDKFRRFVQAITLDHLITLANTHLQALNPRYKLMRGAESNLSIHVVDRDMADEQRAARSLSGGERFLVSLALALALSGLEGRSSFVDTLFIDEGFGALDPETLDIAIGALETLHGRGQKVGVITHVAAMIERVPIQIRIEKRGGGQSAVRITDTSPAWA